MKQITTAWLEAIEGYEAHMVAGARRPRTIILRTYWLGRAAAALGGSPWTVQPGQLVGWVAGETWSAETRRSVRASLVTFWRWGIDMGHTTTNPARVLPAVTPPRAVPKPTPDDVVAGALARASARDALMIRMGAHAGLRRAEIAACRWGDLAGDWLLVQGKGGHERRVPLLGVLQADLEAERELRLSGVVGPGWRFTVDARSPYVFPGLRGGHINPETVGAILGRALGPGWSGHTLRHRFATRALRGTHDLRAVQDLMGHASVVTTQRYTAVDEGALVEAVRWAA